HEPGGRQQTSQNDDVAVAVQRQAISLLPKTAVVGRHPLPHAGGIEFQDREVFSTTAVDSADDVEITVGISHHGLALDTSAGACSQLGVWICEDAAIPARPGEGLSGQRGGGEKKERGSQ